MPRMTTVQRTAIVTPAVGLQVYDTDTNSQWYYNGTVWVNAATAGAEWTYNGTDAIEATRALANGNKVSIDNFGRSYNVLGAWDYTTFMNFTDGTTPTFSSDPKFVWPNFNIKTSDVLGLNAPGYTTGSNALYVYDSYINILKNDHIANSNQTSKRYIGSLLENRLDAINTNITDYTSQALASYMNYNSSSNVTGTFRGLSASANHFGTGNINNLNGFFANASISGTGTATTLQGAVIQASTSSTSTGNITGSFYGITGGVTNSTTGSHTGSLRGISYTTVTNTMAKPSATHYGALFGYTNNSTTVNTGTSSAYGISSTLVNNGPAKYTQFRGLEIATTNNAIGGAFTNGYGINNNITNNSTSTDNITVLGGYSSTTAHNGNSAIGTLYAMNVSTSIGATATGTISGVYGLRINQIKNVASTAVITNNYALYLDPIIASTGHNFSIYSNGGNSYFKDKLLVNTTTATDAMLNVNGAIQVGAYTGGAPVAGMIRFDAVTSKFQGYDGTTWQNLH